MATETDIANLALAVLEEAPITDIDDNDTAARLCKRHFEQTRKAELAKRDWAFALTTDSLTGTDTGEGTLNWSYTYPAGALRILPLTYDGESDGIPISWRQEGGVILSDQDSPRSITYVEDKPDPTDWPPLFVEVFVAALAIKIAIPLTHKSGMLDVAKSAYQTALQDALLANAIRARGVLYTASWAAARGDNRYWRA